MADLKTELTDDPLIRSYAGMTDQQAADDLNTSYRTRNRASMTSSEVYQAVDDVEIAALSQADRDEIYGILGFAEVDPFGREKDRFLSIFGLLSTTITDLAALRVESITRAVELGLRSPVTRAHVTAARS